VPSKTFEYMEAELPTVKPAGVHALPNGETIRYFEISGWMFSDHPTEDGDIRKVRTDILAHIAWLQKLEAKESPGEGPEHEDA
jgi:hypothetical protein